MNKINYLDDKINSYFLNMFLKNISENVSTQKYDFERQLALKFRIYRSLKRICPFQCILNLNTLHSLSVPLTFDTFLKALGSALIT